MHRDVDTQTNNSTESMTWHTCLDFYTGRLQFISRAMCLISTKHN